MGNSKKIAREPLVVRVHKVLGPITGGLLLDFIDFATFGPLGLGGLFIGGVVGWWISSIYNFPKKTRYLWAFAAGVYCLVPFTEFFPIASIVFGLAKLGENPNYKKSMSQHDEYELKERTVLNLIKDEGGKITPIELAAKTKLTFDEAKGFLDNLIEKCSGSTQITESGNLVYVFEGFLSEKDKGTAKDVLEFDEHDHRSREL